MNGIYSWFADLIGAPVDANQTIVLCCCVLVILLFVLSIDIFTNTIFGIFRRRK